VEGGEGALEAKRGGECVLRADRQDGEKVAEVMYEFAEPELYWRGWRLTKEGPQIPWWRFGERRRFWKWLKRLDFGE